MRLILRAILASLAIAFGCAAYALLTLPNVSLLRTSNPSTTAFIELREREAIARGETPRRLQHWINYSRISPNLIRAVLVAEDGSFWKHDGVDYAQIRESMEINLERMEFARGASTITQQLAKNLYLSPSKNPIRKLRELLIARRLEAELSKRRILEIYLNVIEWGEGIYGAGAAARSYFHKPAADLSAHEGALLAGAIINPRLLDPGHPTARLRRRQQLILQRMGAVTPPPVLTDVVAPPAAVPAVVPGAPLPVVGPPTALPGETIPAAGTKPPGGRGPGSSP